MRFNDGDITLIILFGNVYDLYYKINDNYETKLIYKFLPNLRRYDQYNETLYTDIFRNNEKAI